MHWHSEARSASGASVSGRIALATFAVLGLLASAASAQTPVTAGPGSNPRIAVDSKGAGHLAWINVTGNTSTFRYCKLAPTARCVSPSRPRTRWRRPRRRSPR